MPNFQIIKENKTRQETDQPPRYLLFSMDSLCASAGLQSQNQTDSFTTKEPRKVKRHKLASLVNQIYKKTACFKLTLG